VTLALGLAPGASVFAADTEDGGEAALSVARTGPRRVLCAPAVDTEEARALFALKRRAMQVLPLRDYLRLIGLLRAQRAERLDLYHRIRASAPAEMLSWWNDREPIIAAGLFTRDADVETARVLRRLLSTHLGPADYRTLLYAAPAARLALFDDRIGSNVFWRRALSRCAARGRLRCGYGRNDFHQGEPVAALRRMVERGLALSPVWMRGFCSDAGVSAGLPAHLQPAGYRSSRAHVDRVVAAPADASATLERAAPASFDGFAFGNIGDLVGADAFEALLRAAVRAARPGARIVYVSRAREPTVSPSVGLRRDAARTAALEAADRAPICGRWHVLEVRPA
jgi:S-adenosylmethionine:diacylglycerol 3-amino-3-carboxypropyl transferase